jgi:hypothetical protein
VGPKDVVDASWVGPCNFDDYVVGSRFSAPSITEQSAIDAYPLVMTHAGASQRLNDDGTQTDAHDSVDLDIVDRVSDGTGEVLQDEIDFPGFPTVNAGTPVVDDDADGMPNTWETLHGFNAFQSGNPTDDADGDGYTDLEEFLNGTDPLVAQSAPALGRMGTLALLFALAVIGAAWLHQPRARSAIAPS